jgi:Rho-binding antiterminator
MSTAAYVPIACMEHERLEFAVLRRQRLRLDFINGLGVTETRVILPTDVGTREGAEWLNFRTETGEEGVIRLDRIVAFRPADMPSGASG